MTELVAEAQKLLPEGRRLYIVHQDDNPGVVLTDLFDQVVVIDRASWRVLDVSFREGLGDSGSPCEVGITVEPA